MPVFHIYKVWPNSQVPYENPEMIQSVGPTIERFNRVFSKPILIPRTNEHDYAVFKKQESGCSPIGHQKTGMQNIIVKGNPFEIIHEICHCLGFEHEQFHREYLWNDGADTPLNQFLLKKLIGENSKASKGVSGAFLASKPVFTTRIRSGSFGSLGADAHSSKASSLNFAIPTFSGKPKPPKASEEEEEVPMRGGTIETNLFNDNRLSVDNFLNGRKRVQADNGIRSMDICDYNSVMMYSEFRKAAVAAVRADKAPGNRIQLSNTFLPLQNDGCGLSAIDRQVINQMYLQKG